MQLLGTLPEAHAKIWADTQQLITLIAGLASRDVGSLDVGISLLRSIREESYEELNQIQHEHLILVAAEWLVAEKRCPPDTLWYWNPRQTGDSSEPDLRGCVDATVLVSAEVTTSKAPIGTIDKRMAGTLSKLAKMEGQLYYFVRSTAMHKRAQTKITKAQWRIEAIELVVTET